MPSNISDQNTTASLPISPIANKTIGEVKNGNYAFMDNILKKLSETDNILIKEYQLFISGKTAFEEEKDKLLQTVNIYFSNLIESFQNEHQKKIEFLETYYKNITSEFNEIDMILQKNKRIINKAISNINTLKTQNFLEVKLSDQLTLIEELELNSLSDPEINNKIKFFLYRIKKNSLIPKISIDEKLISYIHVILLRQLLWSRYNKK